jgi:DNA primase
VNVDIGKVLARLNIQAKRQGREWVAVCPNREHDDRSPSWRIRDEPDSTRHGYHHCWPCGFKGGILSLVQHVLQLEELSDARAWLEESSMVEQKAVEEVEVKIAPPRLRFRLPPEVTVEPFESWPGPARDYFLSRKLEPWQAERWGIGYAVTGRLRGRLVIVSRNVKGHPMRYTARTFTGEEKRYLEPRPEENANPNVMFGEQHWPALGQRDVLFVVEGAINGLALEAELPGIYFAATAGSSMRPLYAPKFMTWKRIVVMTDPDDAGDKIGKEIETAMCRHNRSIRLRLPVGSDAAKMRVENPGSLGDLVRATLRATRTE